MRAPLLVLLTAAWAIAAPPTPRASPRFLSPQEMVKLMEASPRQYQIDSEPSPSAQWAQQNATLAWPEAHPPLAIPVIKKKPDGSTSVESMPSPGELDAALKKVEPLFEAKDYAGAEKGYAELLAKYPDDYALTLYWGDAAYFAGKHDVALPRYEQATRLNPADHRGWYYRGNALAQLGRKKEAIEAWVKALAMTPANQKLGLESKAAALGYVVKPRTLLPEARITPMKNGFSVSLSKKNPHWLAWGICKAMWRGEASHRKDMTGSEQDAFSGIEEKECLAHLVSLYEKRKEGEPEDPVVEQFVAATEAGLFAGYLHYEIASRIEPHSYLLQKPETQRTIEDYVRRFVLVPATK